MAETVYKWIDREITITEGKINELLSPTLLSSAWCLSQNWRINKVLIHGQNNYLSLFGIVVFILIVVYNLNIYIGYEWFFLAYNNHQFDKGISAIFPPLFFLLRCHFHHDQMTPYFHSWRIPTLHFHIHTSNPLIMSSVDSEWTRVILKPR